MSARINYQKGELLGPHNVPYLNEEDPATEPSGKKIRKAKFLCPVCEENTFITRIKDVKNGKTWRCSNCKAKNTAERFSKDLTGQRFGYLTVTRLGERDNINKKRRWYCDCDCGKKDILIVSSHLLGGKSRSCGRAECPYHQKLLSQMNLQDLTGKRFGKLKVIKLYSLISEEGPLWECECDCGNKKCIFPSKSLLANNRKSCGCSNSKGEMKLQQIFQKNNILYETEVSFKDCVNPETNRKLRFDFYLPDYNVYIEYDEFNILKSLQQIIGIL